ncbi:hypothetical protein JAAARDRAFT_331713 [Jaapia argillacea MUCL 33604]|uniref:Uncharacterized protein n=1 Tax=Jaapia argillacea MUCL 33604 TaxID=933084 RepID=A0A067PX49_9AGAM|nr:hypothetical protein JAAARDRAFT_331713 [Jaapia argillacea MUCL 33604]
MTPAVAPTPDGRCEAASLPSPSHGMYPASALIILTSCIMMCYRRHRFRILENRKTLSTERPGLRMPSHEHPFPQLCSEILCSVLPSKLV